MQIIPINTLMPLEAIGDAQKQGISSSTTLTGGSSFSSMLEEAMTNLRETQQAADRDSYDLAMGNPADLHAVMIRATQSATAIDTAVQLTTRAVASYKEIMQMQV